MASKQKKRRSRGRGDTQQAEALPSEPAAPRPAEVGGWLPWLLGVTVFVSAFLLFQVQPLISKVILPWFGGSPAVWTTCMFFFQVTLLVGYCYAHATTRYLPTSAQAILHVLLVLAGIALLPIEPSTDWKPVGAANDPTWRIIGLLSRTVGVQFLLLSTTAPLIQVWWHRISGQAPYRLYAVSNAGSLLALVSYPFLIEPTLGMPSQVLAWSGAFFALALLVVVAGTLAWRHQGTPQTASVSIDAPAPPWQRYLGWLVLSATGSVLLLAMTNHISQNIAVVPFLWVAPLALYLLSFILAFGDARLYRRKWFGGLMLLSQAACAYLFHFEYLSDVVLLLAIHLTALFAGCMVCHGELARLKPHARYLTSFYVVLSVGGAAGGMFVSLISPIIFLQYYEYPLVLVSCWLILFVVAIRDRASYLHAGRPVWAWGVLLLTFALFLLFLRNGVIAVSMRAYLTRRSFYGVLTVNSGPNADDGLPQVDLAHGVIRHGTQYVDAAKEFEPTMYYRRESGVGLAMQYVAEREQRQIGMLGLGVGTVAAYCKPGDRYRAYEINQDVIDLATDPNNFTFWSLLDKRQASAEIILGDARISLENELAWGQKHDFDVLVVDVFSGDAIPVHLLTREVFELYFQHLADDGILAVHVSNRHLDLIRVLRALSIHFRVPAVHVDDRVSDWVLLAKPGIIDSLDEAAPGQVRSVSPAGPSVLWTDDYSNIFSVLR